MINKLKQLLTKDFLYQEYIVNRKSLSIIAKEVGCGLTTIWRYLIKYGTSLRTVSEANSGKIANNYIDGRCLKQYYCKDCKREINTDTYLYGSKRCRSCSKKGTLHSQYIDGRVNRRYFCINCGKEIGSYQSKRCRSCAHKYIWKTSNKLKNRDMSGKNNPNYIEGLIREYPNKFNKQLKEQIRQRDNHQCQICGKLELELRDYYKKLSIHHIDYDKNNLDPENLITLCQSCHMETNGNRNYWQEYFQNKVLELIIS